MSNLPPHLFMSCGDLYDTRAANWSANPLRKGFSGHGGAIETAAQFKAALRAGEHTDVGGYPLYFVMGDGEPLSFDAARSNLREIFAAFQSGRIRDDWRPVSVEINYEDDDLHCAHSGQKIASAYGNEEAA